MSDYESDYDGNDCGECGRSLSGFRCHDCYPTEAVYSKHYGPPTRETVMGWGSGLGEVIALNLNDPDYRLECVYADARLAASRVQNGRYHIEHAARIYEDAEVLTLQVESLQLEQRQAWHERLRNIPRVRRQNAEVERQWREIEERRAKAGSSGKQRPFGY